MRARYYAPRWGRFLTPDPLGVVAAGNPYAFVGNRPGDFWDPFGLSPVANPNGQSIWDGRSSSINPVTYAILYSDNFVLEHTLQDDRELQVTQQGWMLVSVTALVVAGGGMGYGAATESFAANGGWAGVRMGLIRAGFMAEDVALAEGGNVGVGASTAYAMSRTGQGAGVARVAEDAVESCGETASAGARSSLDQVPSVRDGAFARWFNSLTADEFDQVWSNPELREAVGNRLRSPGGFHEWQLVSRADTFKRWGVTAEQIAELDLIRKAPTSDHRTACLVQLG